MKAGSAASCPPLKGTDRKTLPSAPLLGTDPETFQCKGRCPPKWAPSVGARLNRYFKTILRLISGRAKVRSKKCWERIIPRLPPSRHPMMIQSATQACALTWNQTNCERLPGSQGDPQPLCNTGQTQSYLSKLSHVPIYIFKCSHEEQKLLTGLHSTSLSV